MKKGISAAFVCAMLTAAVAPAQDSGTLNRGMELYGDGRWRDAIIVLRQAAAETSGLEAAQARYWIALAEIGAGDYDSALKDLNDIERSGAAIPQAVEISYQKGRALHHLGRFDESIQLLKAYHDRVDDDSRRAAASFWIGENLFSLGRLDEARAAFSLIVEKYPASAKYEASYYRLALIDQKGRELELLKLLKWSHEESLKNIEEYQRRERSYEQAIVAYQKRIADMLKDTRLADLEREAKDLSAKVASLEAALAAAGQAAVAVPAVSAAAPAAAPPPTPPSKTDTERTARLLAIKASALELRDALVKKLSEVKEGASEK